MNTIKGISYYNISTSVSIEIAREIIGIKVERGGERERGGCKRCRMISTRP